METLDALGNGELNDGLNPTDGKYIDLNCQTWAYDCGDNPAFSEDVFNVCFGELPPENGCIEFVPGCMNPVACNFDPSAIIDDNSCVLADDGFDCDGNCLIDSDSDGICDAFEVPGCASPSACNYDMHATDDDAVAISILVLGAWNLARPITIRMPQWTMEVAFSLIFLGALPTSMKMGT